MVLWNCFRYGIYVSTDNTRMYSGGQTPTSFTTFYLIQDNGFVPGMNVVWMQTGENKFAMFDVQCAPNPKHKMFISGTSLKSVNPETGETAVLATNGSVDLVPIERNVSTVDTVLYKPQLLSYKPAVYCVLETMQFTSSRDPAEYVLEFDAASGGSKAVALRKWEFYDAVWNKTSVSLSKTLFLVRVGDEIKLYKYRGPLKPTGVMSVGKNPNGVHMFPTGEWVLMNAFATQSTPQLLELLEPVKVVTGPDSLYWLPAVVEIPSFGFVEIDADGRVSHGESYDDIAQYLEDAHVQLQRECVQVTYRKYKETFARKNMWPTMQSLTYLKPGNMIVIVTGDHNRLLFDPITKSFCVVKPQHIVRICQIGKNRNKLLVRYEGEDKPALVTVYRPAIVKEETSQYRLMQFSPCPSSKNLVAFSLDYKLQTACMDPEVLCHIAVPSPKIPVTLFSCTQSF